MGMMHSRLRAPETGSLLLIVGGLTASLILNLANYYLIAILVLQAVPYLQVMGVSIGVVIYLGAVRLLLSANPALRRISVSVTAAVIIVQLVRTVIFILLPENVTLWIHIPAISLISAYLLYVGVVLYRSGRKGENGTVDALLRRTGLLLCIFAPVSTVFYALIDLIPKSARPYVSLDFVFMVALSSIIISAFVRYLALPPNLLRDNAVSPAFIRSFGITSREAEVIGLVGRGLSNKEIADRMHISLTTARTHLYNIFQKTGAGSRIDLLRLAGGYRE
jgi:DNA-binding CsgD family transcriptional regulator